MKMKLKDLKAFHAADDRTILVMGPFCWGKGQTGTEAFKKAKENLSYYRKPLFIFYDAPKDAWVDSYGSIHWKEGKEEIDEIGRFKGK